MSSDAFGQRPVAAEVPYAEAALNYRHHFHAGNFADLLKHGLVLQLLQRLTADASPVAVLDTHAGAGSACGSG